MNTSKNAFLVNSFLLFMVVVISTSAHATKRALLIGISDYEDNTFINGQNTPDLEGPVNDVLAFREILVSKWGFKKENIVMLLDRQATKKKILNGMNHIARISQKNDEVLIYYSGHGIRGSMISSNSTSIRTGILVPFDFKRSADASINTTQLIVARRDYRDQLLKKLDDKGVHTWFVVDACFSGGAYRGLKPYNPGVVRSTYAPVNVIKNSDFEQNSLFPYKNLVFFAASSATQAAWDIAESDLLEYPTFDGKPHGAFSDALFRVMKNSENKKNSVNQLVSYADFFHAMRRNLKQRRFKQTPQMQPSSFDVKVSSVNKPLLGQKQNTTLLYAKKNPTELISIDGRIQQKIKSDLLERTSLSKGPKVKAGFTRPLLAGEFPLGKVEKYGVTVDESAHVLVLNITPNGNVVIIYPARPQELRRRSGGGRLDISMVVDGESSTGGEMLLVVAVLNPNRLWTSFFSENLNTLRFRVNSEKFKSLKNVLEAQVNMTVFSESLSSVDVASW